MKRPKISTIFRYYNENWKVPLAFLLEKLGHYFKVENFGIFCNIVLCGYFLPALYVLESSFLFLRREFQKGFTLGKEGVFGKKKIEGPSK